MASIYKTYLGSYRWICCVKEQTAAAAAEMDRTCAIEEGARKLYYFSFNAASNTRVPTLFFSCNLASFISSNLM